MVEVKIDFGYAEQKALSEEISKQFDKEMRENIKKAVSTGITLDHTALNKIVRDVIKQEIHSEVKINLSKSIENALEGFREELKLLKLELVDATAKLMDNFHSGETLSNVRIQFWDWPVAKKTDAEELVKKHYEDKGFKVQKFRSFLTWDSSRMEHLFPYSKFEPKGCPDLVVYDSHWANWFLVEVKTNGDGVKLEQMGWYLNYPKIPIVIFFVDQKIKEPELNIP